MSQLFLQNTSGLTFDRVEVVVEADAGYAKFQDSTVLKGVDKATQVIGLPRIPLKELTFNADNTVSASFESVRVTVSVLDKSVDERCRNAESLTMSPTYTELLNSKWDKKWGYIWNLNYIERTKSEMVAYIKFHLATQRSIIQFQWMTCHFLTSLAVFPEQLLANR